MQEKLEKHSVSKKNPSNISMFKWIVLVVSNFLNSVPSSKNFNGKATPLQMKAMVYQTTVTQPAGRPADSSFWRTMFLDTGVNR